MKTCLMVIGLLVLSTDAFANRMDRREHSQRARIREGVRSGELTRHEARKLAHEQKRIHRMERHAEKDGHVTDAEKQKIENAQDHASKNIHEQKHDEEKR